MLITNEVVTKKTVTQNLSDNEITLMKQLIALIPDLEVGKKLIIGDKAKITAKVLAHKLNLLTNGQGQTNNQEEEDDEFEEEEDEFEGENEDEFNEEDESESESEDEDLTNAFSFLFK